MNSFAGNYRTIDELYTDLMRRRRPASRPSL
jgi:hypothetical protein